MSAARTRHTRSQSRCAQASPYARPPPKKSFWSLTGFFNYLNPLRSRSPIDSPQSEQHSNSADEPTEVTQRPAETLSARGQQMERDIIARDGASVSSQPAVSSPVPQASQEAPAPPVTPVRQRGFVTFHESSSPAKNLETVSTFLMQKAGEPMSEIEVEGIISLIQKSTPPEKPEPFRFSSSTPSTPASGNSPFPMNTNGFNFSFNTLSSSQNQPTTPSPRKTLSKNPNGVYRWAGGGSAKPVRTRNRYSSPAFGPPRSAPGRLVLNGTSDVPKSGTERRRVGGGAMASSAGSGRVSLDSVNGSVPHPLSHSAAPGPSPTRMAQSLPFPASSGSPAPRASGGAISSLAPRLDGVSAASHHRTPALTQKPTAPAVPSPLRQAWFEGSSTSQGDAAQSQVQNQSRQTKAANFMTELIKEVTPPKRPDLSNPYQTASPVGKVGGPSKHRAIKRPRATGRPSAPDATEEKNNEKKVKVAEKDDAKEAQKEYSPQAIIEATLPKGSKRSRPPPPPAPITKNVGPPSLTPPNSGATNPSTTTGKSGFGGLKTTSAPKEPSKLRYSYQPESGNSPPVPVLAAPPAPASASTPSQTPTTSQDKMDTREDLIPETKTKPSTVKEVALAMAVDSLPVFLFSYTSSSTFSGTPQHVKAREQAKLTPKFSLPSFDFSSRASKDEPAQVAAPKLHPAVLPVKLFDWSAAGLKPAGAGGDWTCSTCMLSNPAIAIDKCTVCDAPR